MGMHACRLHGEKPVRFMGYSLDDCPACAGKRHDEHIREIVRDELKKLVSQPPNSFDARVAEGARHPEAGHTLTKEFEELLRTTSAKVDK